MTAQSMDYVVHTLAEGRIVSWGRASAEDIPLQAGPGEGVVAGAGDDASHWVNPATGLIEQRPAIVLPATEIVAIAAEWEIGPAPAGTEVMVDGDLVATTAGDALVLQFSVSAVYEVALRPPFPWRASTCIVAVV